MHADLRELTYDVRLQAGEELSLPSDASKVVGPGCWRITIEPSQGESLTSAVRDHSALLNSYEPQDDGLYDDYPTG